MIEAARSSDPVRPALPQAGNCPRKKGASHEKRAGPAAGAAAGVKSLVTLALTAVFAALAFTKGVDQDFMTIYTVVIAFYFGTQAERNNQSSGGGGE